jgi:hypothetical protein
MVKKSSSIWKNTKMTVRKLTMIAMVVALCSTIRISFSYLPNVTPITTIYLLICLNFGLSEAIIIADMTIIVTSLYLGMGYWVPGQLLAYSLIIFLYWLVMRIDFFERLVMQGILAFVLGLIYGIVISAFMSFVLKISSFEIYYLAGLPFDLMHGIENFLFMLLIFRPAQLLKKRLLN